MNYGHENDVYEGDDNYADAIIQQERQNDYLVAKPEAVLPPRERNIPRYNGQHAPANPNTYVRKPPSVRIITPPPPVVTIPTQRQQRPVVNYQHQTLPPTPSNGQREVQPSMVDITYSESHFIDTRPPQPLPYSPQNDITMNSFSPSSTFDNRNKNLPATPQTASKSRWMVASIVILVLFCLGLVGGLLYLILDKEVSSQECTQNPDVVYKSCKDLDVECKSGYYQFILFDNLEVKTTLYCDMEHDDGGWTLVASINEDDYMKTCDNEDRWIEAGSENTNSSTWGDPYPFGLVSDATRNDYKSAAYHVLNASELMFWYVNGTVELTNNFTPSNAYVADMKRGSNDSWTYANLYEFYVQNPLQVLPDDLLINTYLKGLNDLNLEDCIEFWVDYVYLSSSFVSLDDNSNRMEYMVTTPQSTEYECNKSTSDVRHNTSKICGDLWNINTIFSSSSGRVFHALSVIGSCQNCTITLDVTTSGNSFNISSRMKNGGSYQINANIAQEFYKTTSNETRITQLFYVVSSTNAGWDSSSYDSFTTNYSTSAKMNTVLKGGSNYVFGYTLLMSNATISDNEIDDVLKTLLDFYSTFPDLNVLSTKYDVDVFRMEQLNGTARATDPEMSYMQLIAHNVLGYPNAICPYKNTTAMQPETVCIGGVAEHQSDQSCNDFANTKSATETSDWRTLMIFYR